MTSLKSIFPRLKPYPKDYLIMSKLTQLASDFGFDDPLDLVGAYIYDGVMPAICMNPNCDYSVEMEPDQDQGWCECCGTNTVKSAAILMGVI